MPGTSSSSFYDTPRCSGVGNWVTCHKGRTANQLPEPGLSRPHTMMGKTSWDPLTSLNGESDLCRDRKTHAVGKDLTPSCCTERAMPRPTTHSKPTAKTGLRPSPAPTCNQPAIYQAGQLMALPDLSGGHQKQTWCPPLFTLLPRTWAA